MAQNAPMPDFGVLPPEINSARMYAGPGSGPMLAAASSWDALATQLSAAATGYGCIVSDLAGYDWRGPSSQAMARAATQYVQWLHDTAERAEKTAAQARAAAAAYEAAFAMTVPPVVIAANRSLLGALVATNFFGQNSPAIAATEAHYAAMWLQDATAMYCYAGSSEAASKLTPFAWPHPVIDPTGFGAQSGTITHTAGNALASQLPTLMQPASPIDVLSPAEFAFLLNVLDFSIYLSWHAPQITSGTLASTAAAKSGIGLTMTNMRLAAQAARNPLPAAGLAGLSVPGSVTGPGGSTASTVSAGTGRSVAIGALSAPPSWAQSAPEIRPAASTSPAPAAAVADAGDTPLASESVFSQSLLGTLSRDGPDTRSQKAKSKPIIVRSPAAG